VFRPADTCAMLWLCRRGAALLLPWAEHRSAPTFCICRPVATLTLRQAQGQRDRSRGVSLSKGGGLRFTRVGLRQARPTGRMQHQSCRTGLLSHICLETQREWR
jgi:hypothetical protein